MLMMCAIGLMSYQKDKKPRNKVHFYVTVGALGGLELWIGKPIYGYNMWVADDKNCSFCVRQEISIVNLIYSLKISMT